MIGQRRMAHCTTISSILVSGIECSRISEQCARVTRLPIRTILQRILFEFCIATRSLVPRLWIGLLSSPVILEVWKPSPVFSRMIMIDTFVQPTAGRCDGTRCFGKDIYFHFEHRVSMNVSKCKKLDCDIVLGIYFVELIILYIT